MKKLVILIFTMLISALITTNPTQAAESRTYRVSDIGEIVDRLDSCWKEGILNVQFKYKAGSIDKQMLDIYVEDARKGWFSPEGKTLELVSKKYTKTTYKIKVKVVKSELETLLDKRIEELDLKNPNYSDAEKVWKVTLFIWDGAHYEIDHDNAEENMVKVLKQEDGGLACEEYAKLLKKFCDKLDITAYYVVRKKKDHAFLAIKFDNVFYKVDITGGAGHYTVFSLGKNIFSSYEIENGKGATEWTQSLIDLDTKYNLGLIQYLNEPDKEEPLEEGEYEVEGTIN